MYSYLLIFKCLKLASFPSYSQFVNKSEAKFSFKLLSQSALSQEKLTHKTASEQMYLDDLPSFSGRQHSFRRVLQVVTWIQRKVGAREAALLVILTIQGFSPAFPHLCQSWCAHLVSSSWAVVCSLLCEQRDACPHKTFLFTGSI